MNRTYFDKLVAEIGKKGMDAMLIAPSADLAFLIGHMPLFCLRFQGLFVTKEGKVVTPKSDTILPSITRRSLMYVAKEYLGLEVEEREVSFDEVKEFAECGLCGTAAVISPVGKVVDHGKEICFPSGMDAMGPVTKKLYDTLTGIQMGQIEAPEGWIHVVC